MKIAIGCDHIVTDIKMKISEYLKSKGHVVIDVGTYDFDRTHYPIFGRKVGRLVSENKVDRGIVLCGTGVGISTSADKITGVRCALVRDAYVAKKAKEEMDINVIGIGGKIVGVDAIKTIIDEFLKAEYKPNKERELLLKQIREIEKELSLTENEDIFKEELEKWDKGYYHH